MSRPLRHDSSVSLNFSLSDEDDDGRKRGNKWGTVTTNLWTRLKRSLSMDSWNNCSVLCWLRFEQKYGLLVGSLSFALCWGTVSSSGSLRFPGRFPPSSRTLWKMVERGTLFTRHPVQHDDYDGFAGIKRAISLICLELAWRGISIRAWHSPRPTLMIWNRPDRVTGNATRPKCLAIFLHIPTFREGVEFRSKLQVIAKCETHTFFKKCEQALVNL